MANTLLTSSVITNEALRILENNLTFAKGVNRQYESKFGVDGAKIGDTLNIRKPVRYVGRTGKTLDVENATESSVALQLDTQFGVDINFSSADLLLNIDMFSERFLKPAIATIANKIDRSGLALYKDVYNAVGTPGTTPTAWKTYLQAGAKMDHEGVPRDGLRSCVMGPSEQVELVDALKGLFHSSDKISDQYKTGNMGLSGGIKFSMDQNVNAHTVGTYGGTPLVNGANQTGASLVTDGWSSGASTLNEGDIFTIDGVYAVNPQSRQSTGQLRQFVVTSTVSDTSGDMTIAISPSIITSGAFQTVTASPANDAGINVLGASAASGPANLMYHRDAFTLATADLPLPKGVDMAARVSDPQLGISLRMVRQYDINNDNFPCRIEVLYGWKTLYAELACRVCG